MARVFIQHKMIILMMMMMMTMMMMIKKIVPMFTRRNVDYGGGTHVTVFVILC